MARPRNVWGSVRKLPSGRYQARCTVNGRSHSAPTTCGTKREADAFLAGVRADLGRGRWMDRRPLPCRCGPTPSGDLPSTRACARGPGSSTRLATAAYPAHPQRRGHRRAGGGHGAVVASNDAGRRLTGAVDGGEVLPAGAGHPQHGGGGRGHRPQSLRTEGRRRGAGTGTPGGDHRPGERAGRRHRAEVPSDGAAGRVRRAAPR